MDPNKYEFDSVEEFSSQESSASGYMCQGNYFCNSSNQHLNYFNEFEAITSVSSDLHNFAVLSPMESSPWNSQTNSTGSSIFTF